MADLKDFKFNKSFGQNFIFDKNLLHAIVSDTGADKNTSVLEIGAGAGTLTAEICKVAGKVISYEIDNNLKPILDENLNQFLNSEIIFKDIMKVDMTEIESKFDTNYIMIANLPYYITTPIIFKFLENSKKLTAMYIMVQEEVADRICSEAGSENYGAITPSIDAVATAKVVRKVNRKMFTPSPNVDSAILQIKFENKYLIKSKEVLDKLIKSAFAMRRKTLQNNLKPVFKFSSDELNDIYTNFGLNPQIRGEKLNTSQFVEMSNYIFEKYGSRLLKN